MRADMAQVIIERPRYGSSDPSRKKSYRKHQQRTPLDEQPRHEPMLGRWRGMSKMLNEHLGPLRRFLRSRVGRPWNNVHRELCEHVSFDNAVQKHILAHIHESVSRVVERVGDQIYDRDRRWGGHNRGLRPGELYVDPDTGYLQIVKPIRRRQDPLRIARPEGLNLQREGIWWQVTVRPLPLDRRHGWDIWLERPLQHLDDARCQTTYGQAVYAVAQRPLNARASLELLRLYWSTQPRRKHGRTSSDMP
jgi:hypothetical protein